MLVQCKLSKHRLCASYSTRKSLTTARNSLSLQTQVLLIIGTSSLVLSVASCIPVRLQ
uniref:Uncharacterized protein n=1 Tax=Triticum urartu TaxID=4572 RepID=A0A8R7QBW8_TRIUA